jgi:hypothetical protein
MIKLANYIDLLVTTELTNAAYNWVGTPGTVITSPAAFFRAPNRLDNLAVPVDSRVGLTHPNDYWGVAGALTGTYIDGVNATALKKAKLPLMGNVDMYMSQNVITHTNGNWGTSTMSITTTLSVSYTTAKDTVYLSMSTQIKNTAATAVVNAGDVFTITGVNSVNPITKNDTGFLQQFVVVSTVTASAAGLASVTIAPAIITSGPYQTVTAAPADSATITWQGSSATAYTNSLCYHKDAATLAMPALQKPQGAAWCESRGYEGFNLRLVQGYDMVNDLQSWRFDCLVGVLAHQPNLITRVSG